jgi:hypothetical protein
MFLTAFKTTGLAIAEIFILGLLGFFLIKRKILSYEGLDGISRLVIEIALPLFIFCKFIKEFSFSLYPNWWIFPILSVALTVLGFAISSFFLWTTRNPDEGRQFISLVGFQNSGYLPLPLVAAMLPPNEAGQMFIYIFLFLVGFNLLMWSWGVYLLTYHKARRFEFGSLFSPPVVATLIGLLCVWLKLENSLPNFVFRPLKMVGDCTLPLAIFVVGASLAEMELGKGINKPALFFICLLKLAVLPLIVLAVLIKVKISYLIALLLLIQATMPPATTLSVIIRHYKKTDHLVSPAIFIGHIISILTIPLFLSLFFSSHMIK